MVNIFTQVEYLGTRVNQIDPTKYLAKCGVDSPGQKCTITRTDAFTQEVSFEFGATAEAVSASIGISQSQTVSIQAGCTSPEMLPAQEYIAFPTETRYYYRVIEDIPEYSDQNVSISASHRESPVTYTSYFDKGVRCRVQQQPT